MRGKRSDAEEAARHANQKCSDMAVNAGASAGPWERLNISSIQYVLRSSERSATATGLHVLRQRLRTPWCSPKLIRRFGRLCSALLLLQCEGAHASLVVDAVKGLGLETTTEKVTII